MLLIFSSSFSMGVEHYKLGGFSKVLNVDDFRPEVLFSQLCKTLCWICYEISTLNTLVCYNIFLSSKVSPPSHPPRSIGSRDCWKISGERAGSREERLTSSTAKMFRNMYDTDVTVWSPEGRLLQVGSRNDNLAGPRLRKSVAAVASPARAHLSLPLFQP